MKFMNINKFRYQDDVTDGGDGSGGDAVDTTSTDGGDTTDDINLSDDDTNDDGVKLGDDDKGDAKGDTPDGAPDEYAEFTPPEGIELDKDMLGKVTPLFKELNLSQEQAQKLVDFQASATKDAVDSLSNQHIETVKQWKADLRADSEIGGDKLDENLSNAKMFLKAHGSAELTKYLDDSGLSNNPLLIKAFSKAGSSLREDNPGSEKGNGSQDGLSDEEKRLQRLYPTKE